jgi:hypothetical protein
VGLKLFFFVYLEAHLGREIPYPYAQSNFNENFFKVWANKFVFV